MELEKRGVRTVVVGTDRFKRLAEVERRSLGMPELTMAIAEHPFGGLRAEKLLAKADGLLEQVVQGLTGHR
ncbi:MAG: hypothetical protein J4O11_12510 [Chloroflexi bacterium]|nr:hypothetical protein [Chloroflexota bacterium]MCI0901577.1 hypothetical protein [Chloroflexota bacterium]